MIVAVVVVVGIVGYFVSRKSNPAFAQVGDCINYSSNTDVKVVDCGSGDAEYKVVKRVDGTSGTTACDDVADSDVSLYTEGGGKQYTLCVSLVLKKGDCISSGGDKVPAPTPLPPSRCSRYWRGRRTTADARPNPPAAASTRAPTRSCASSRRRSCGEGPACSFGAGPSLRLPRPGGAGVTLPADPPGGPPADPDEIFQRFTDWAAGQGLTLYPHQEEALLHLVTGDNVVAATPTGSGKSLVAVAALFAARSTGRRGWYTAPIKALVSEKFFEMVAIFGADDVGMITGDSAVNPDAPIICCTAEILAGVALAIRPRRRRRGRRHGRVPLLRRPAARLGLAGAAAGTCRRPSSS